MWPIIIALSGNLLIYGLNLLTRPKSPAPIPRTRDSLDLPRTEEGTPVPIVFGRCQVKSPVLAWASDLNSLQSPDDRWISYGMHMLFVVGVPMGNSTTRANQLNGSLLFNVWMGDKKLPSPGPLPQVGWNTTAIYNQMQVSEPSWLGGPGNGGGLFGTYQWFGGWTDQSFVSPPSRIGDAMTPTIPAARIPGHRKQMCVAFSYMPSGQSDPYFTQTYIFSGQQGVYPNPQGFVLGENPNVNGIAFEVSAYGDKVFSMVTPGTDFGGDADPVEVIYDIMTNQWSRLGLDPSVIDTPSWLAASTTLKAEGHGYSNAHYQSEDAHNVITGILQQIDATLYWEPTTGKFIFNLIRFDYDVSLLPSYVVDDIIEVTSYSMGAWRETVNEVRVKFTDRAQQYNTATVVAASLANAVGNNNRRRPKEISYPGCTSQKLAAKLAARDLNVLSTPLAKISVTFNRSAWMLRPGQVFKLTDPEYGLTNVVFRVAHVDLGQLHDNKVTVEAVQDAFASTYAGQSNDGPGAELVPTPLAQRTVIEAPRWLQLDAHAAGLINDPDVTRLLALPAPGVNDTEFYVNSVMVAASTSRWSGLLEDVPRQPFPITLQVAADYPRHLEPYDTTTGLVVNNLQGEVEASLLQRTATYDQISKYGRNLWLIMRSSGEHEIIACESATSLGGGSYRLNNVWRGLLDTVPIHHSIGESMFLINAGLVGRKSWKPAQQVLVQSVPVRQAIAGSGAESVDTFPTTGYKPVYSSVGGADQVIGRSFRPLPAANVAAFGEGSYGVIGSPPAFVGTFANSFKTISLLEEGIDLFGFKRELRQTVIVRGDGQNDVMHTGDGATTYEGAAAPSGALYPDWVSAGNGVEIALIPRSAIDSALVTYGGFATNIQTIAEMQYVFDWYGSIDIGMVSVLSLSSTNPAIGKGGLDAFVPLQSGPPAQRSLASFATPRVAAVAPSWRNLLANARFNYALVHVGSPVAVWGAVSGTATLSHGSFSLAGNVNGPGSYYLNGLGAFTVAQNTFNATWMPRGLTAVAIAYIKNSSAVGTGRLDLSDSGGGSVAGTATTGATTNWKRLQTSMTVVGGGDHVTASLVSSSGITAFTETELRIGQFQTNVLTNYSFDTGTLTGWTNIINTFSVFSPAGAPSAAVCQGGAFAQSQIRQEYTLPAGWEINATAFLTCFRYQSLVGDTGSVTLSAVDGSGTVLATATTGVEELTAKNTYMKRTLFCDVPVGTTKIRVDLLANRATGAGSSTALFDEIVLSIAKDLAPRSRTLIDLGAPSPQPTPNTLGAFHLAYPTLPVPDYVFGGTTANDEEVVWIDQAMRAIGKFTGQFGGVVYQPSVPRTIPKTTGTSSIDAYVFTRGSGSGAAHLAAVHQGYSIGAYSSVQSFSVGVLYAIDEATFGGRCGLIGRMDLGQGWGLELDATGHLTAVMRGAGSTSVFITLPRVSSEGGRHWAWIVYDAVAQTVTVSDELGSAFTSTTTLGEIKGAGPACHLRIGRDADDADVMPGMIARAFLFDVALTSGQIASISSYGKDPTGLITTYTRTGSAWHTVPSDAAGEVLTCAGPGQIAMPWHPSLAQDDSFNTDSAGYPAPPWVQTYKRSGHGLAVGRSSTNRISSWDFTNATVWVPDASTVLTQGVVDATGRARGVTVAGNATNGLKVVSVAVGAVARNATLTFWARGTAGTNNLTIELLTSAAALVTGATVSLTALWQRFDVVLAFSGATATCQWRLRSTTGSLTFDLTSVVHSSEWSTTTAFVPSLIAPPGQSTGDVSAVIATTLPASFNKEGELVATFTALRDPDATLSPSVGTLVRVNNGANAKNARDLQLRNAGGVLAFSHTDGAASPATTTSTLAAPSSTIAGVVTKLRGRWQSLGLLEPSLSLFSSVAASDSAHSTVSYGTSGRSATWTNDTTPSTQITLGAGTAACDPVLLSFVTVQSREEKLP